MAEKLTTTEMIEIALRLTQQGSDGWDKKTSACCDLIACEKYVTFCWHGLRSLRSASVHWGGYDIAVEAMCSRVCVTFEDVDGDCVSFMGKSDGYIAGLHGCLIDIEKCAGFGKFCESFADAFSVEMFMVDEGLVIG